MQRIVPRRATFVARTGVDTARMPNAERVSLGGQLAPQHVPVCILRVNRGPKKKNEAPWLRVADKMIEELGHHRKGGRYGCPGKAAVAPRVRPTVAPEGWAQGYLRDARLSK